MARAHFDGLSRQLKLIARHVEANRERMGLEGIQETAAKCGVQPSAVVRFAQHFGLSGFSEMQALFRHEAAQKLVPHPDYRDRIRSLVGSGARPLASARIAEEVIRGSVESLQALEAGLAHADFEAAVALMVEAKALWLVAARRAFPVGAYLAYALQQTSKPIHWLNGLGHMQHAEMRAMSEGDVMIAVSFDPYAKETLEVVEAALARGARLIALTDSKFSPLVRQASATLLVQDSAPYGFRSLTSTLCLAQSLFISLAYRMELEPPRLQR
ncbi:MurR/RpiR family transcriptional regulator [Pseudorhodoferax sp.]|uniref:MurR/RpiR family transcriptional regulator n=1 Tax=Pseudorhodoferax sp. TaxID=1993553 RepID=UPI0039E38210